jgi:hypothetical protein
VSKPRTQIGWVDSIYVNMGLVLGPRRSIDRYFPVEATDLKEDERGWRVASSPGDLKQRNRDVLVLYIVKEEEHNGNVDSYASPMYKFTQDLKAPRLRREMAEVCRNLSLVYSELMATDSPK